MNAYCSQESEGIYAVVSLWAGLDDLLVTVTLGAPFLSIATQILSVL